MCVGSLAKQRWKLSFAWTSIVTGRQVGRRLALICMLRMLIWVVALAKYFFFLECVVFTQYWFKPCSYIIQVYVSTVICAALVFSHKLLVIVFVRWHRHLWKVPFWSTVARNTSFGQHSVTCVWMSWMLSMLWNVTRNCVQPSRIHENTSCLR